MGIAKKLKLYIKTTKPNKLLFALQLLGFICVYLLNVYVAIPTARATTSITNGDVYSTIKWLIIVCAVVCFQMAIYVLLNRLYYWQYRHIWRNVNGQIYDKIVGASQSAFETTSKEKIINILNNNLDNLGSFPEYFCKYFSYFVQAVVTIVVLLTYNVYIGLAVIVLCFGLYFLMSFVDRLNAKNIARSLAYQDKAMEVLSDSYGNRDLTRDLNLSGALHEKFMNNLRQSQKYVAKEHRCYSFLNTWVQSIYQGILLLCTIYMAMLVRANIFTLTIYLVLASYLSKAVTQMTTAFGFIERMEVVGVSTMRVQTILNMEQADIIEYGHNTTDEINSCLALTNVSYTSRQENFAGKIKPFSATLEAGTASLFFGSPKCGKRAIFYMLRRTIRPDTGTITVGGINIFDFESKTYIHNLSYAVSKPFFFNTNIMENLLASGCTREEAFAVCKKLGLYDKIIKTQKSFATNLTKEPNVLNIFDKYLLGIARALATKSEVILVYEIPTGLSAEQKAELKKIFSGFAKDHTLVIFSNNDYFADICKKVYKIDNGTTKEIKNNL